MSRIVKGGILWDFFNINFVAKYQKIDGGPFGAVKKNSEKMRNLNSLTVPKKREKSHSVEKSGKGMAFYLMLEALDVLKMKY